MVSRNTLNPEVNGAQEQKPISGFKPGSQEEEYEATVVAHLTETIQLRIEKSQKTIFHDMINLPRLKIAIILHYRRKLSAYFKISCEAFKNCTHADN